MPKGKKVLILDDNADFLFSIKTLLTRSGFEVLTADNGKQGIEDISREKPDLIILDVMMESLFSGFEVCKRVRLDPELKSTPVIAVSGMADEIQVRFEKETDSEYFNPDIYMEKPVDQRALLTTINRLLHL